MAYLYADPVVKLDKYEKMQPVPMPLDLEIEYQSIIDNLKSC